MASSHADNEFITERQARYEKAYNAADVDTILSFMSEGIEFCDYSNSPLPTSIQSPTITLTTPPPLTGVGMLNLSKPAIHAFFTNMFASCANFDLQTVSISGHKNFTTWEWNLTFNYVRPASEAGGEAEFQADMADGRLMKMIGVSVSWWNDEGKIIKNHDYAKVVENFEGR